MENLNLILCVVSFIGLMYGVGYGALKAKELKEYKKKIRDLLGFEDFCSKITGRDGGLIGLSDEFDEIKKIIIDKKQFEITVSDIKKVLYEYGGKYYNCDCVVGEVFKIAVENGELRKKLKEYIDKENDLIIETYRKYMNKVINYLGVEYRVLGFDKKENKVFVNIHYHVNGELVHGEVSISEFDLMIESIKEK